ncbi:hypothetical protein [Pseudomonas lini]|uniref:hypothetical protein n=1 Tax=Pseudomonas lini TaxID=163011 RepID=UPI000682F71F|nr:hypothetical protein [Pseudomonas lini]KNH43912.1 hypothetical protein ACS73_23525 [Pseudomonas lini]
MKNEPVATAVEKPEQMSFAYREGLRARQDGIKLKDSAIKNLRIGSRQYDDYLAGYDRLDASKLKAQKQAG